jgi:hypothetical protein
MKEDTSAQRMWYGKLKNYTKNAGDAWDAQTNPTDIVRAIAAKLGGLPPKGAEYLAQVDAKLLPQLKKIELPKLKKVD